MECQTFHILDQKLDICCCINQWTPQVRLIPSLAWTMEVWQWSWFCSDYLFRKVKEEDKDARIWKLSCKIRWVWLAEPDLRLTRNLELIPLYIALTKSSDAVLSSFCCLVFSVVWHQGDYLSSSYSSLRGIASNEEKLSSLSKMSKSEKTIWQLFFFNYGQRRTP